MGTRRRKPRRLADDIAEPRRFYLDGLLKTVFDLILILGGVAMVVFLLFMYRFLL
jgi:hypothetical protein